jgi:hypothetical protein
MKILDLDLDLVAAVDGSWPSLVLVCIIIPLQPRAAA